MLAKTYHINAQPPDGPLLKPADVAVEVFGDSCFWFLFVVGGGGGVGECFGEDVIMGFGVLSVVAAIVGWRRDVWVDGVFLLGLWG